MTGGWVAEHAPPSGVPAEYVKTVPDYCRKFEELPAAAGARRAWPGSAGPLLDARPERLQVGGELLRLELFRILHAGE
jgi:hypothetical protein